MYGIFMLFQSVVGATVAPGWIMDKPGGVGRIDLIRSVIHDAQGYG